MSDFVSTFAARLGGGDKVRQTAIEGLLEALLLAIDGPLAECERKTREVCSFLDVWRWGGGNEYK